MQSLTFVAPSQSIVAFSFTPILFFYLRFKYMQNVDLTLFLPPGQINAAAGNAKEAVEDFVRLFELSKGNLTAVEYLLAISGQLRENQMLGLISKCLLPVRD